MKSDEKKMPELAQPTSEPAWIEAMRQYHVATGGYRQEEVFRLLGAPWERVEIQLSASGPAASCVCD
ncbi:MAG: hypothetical protein DI591_09445 [Citromicrobium sp.]|nr:MAG: hypothetical protein DI591_09445 [Citromicrobium sp.]